MFCVKAYFCYYLCLIKMLKMKSFAYECDFYPFSCIIFYIVFQNVFRLCSSETGEVSVLTPELIGILSPI
jgi:hypothetical protein